MNARVTLDQITGLISELQGEPSLPTAQPQQRKTSLLASLSTDQSNPETPSEIEKLHSALAVVSSDVGRGNGAFFKPSGEPEHDNWLACIWAINSLGWSCGKKIAQQWSMTSPRYDEQGFEDAWNSYNPDHPNPTGIGSLYKRAIELGWSYVTQSAPAVDRRFRLIGAAELKSRPPLAWAIKGILPASGLATIYGPSGSGKSFLALDMAEAIASGSRWFGHRTYQRPVVYIALEGEAGYKNRVEAWEMAYGQSPQGISFVLQPFRLTEATDVASMSATVPTKSVIIIDTLNRAAPTADENSSKDMGEIIDGAKRLQVATDSLVILVHHTGKDRSRGLRGHSSLHAALDAAIEVIHEPPNRAFSVVKAKDGAMGQPFPFILDSHVIGADADGDPITSCTIRRTFNLLPSPPTGKNQILAFNAIRQAISQSNEKGRGGSPAHSNCLRGDDAVSGVAPLLSCAQNKRRNIAKKLITDLSTRGNICTGTEAGEGWVWLPN